MDFLIKHWAPYPRRFPATFRVVSTDFIKRKTDRVAWKFGTCNFSLILRGGGDFVRNGRIWPVVAPCVLTQWPGDVLSYGPSGEHETWDECYVIYPGDVRAKLTETGFIDETRPVWPIQNLPAVQEHLRELHQLTRSMHPESVADRVDRVWERILLETILTPAPAEDDAEVIHRIQAQVKENLARPLDMDVLAKQLGLSLPTLRRHWAAVVKTPPSRYQQELRIQAASRMLVETGLAVKHIAREVGFDDELYFSRRFRASTGVAPSDYREAYRLDPARGLRTQG
ncbi:MAG: AraC family transcriptional regulator [Rariglobus sp.]